jgi:hypothetical protein
MNDANGGAGNLKGHISGVSLKCGSVETFANLYVGDAVPFDLLLGRPWQRDNLVTIDERMDGTYLVFKDPDNVEVTYELLVEDHAPRPEYPFDIQHVPEIKQADFKVTMITSSKDLVEDNGPSPMPGDISSGPPMPERFSEDSPMPAEIYSETVMPADMSSDSYRAEELLGAEVPGTRKASPFPGGTGEKDFDSNRSGNSLHDTTGTAGTELMPLFHLRSNLNYMRHRVRHQEKLILEAIAQHITTPALHHGWESLEYMCGPEARSLGLTGVFQGALHRLFDDLVRKTTEVIAHKYLQDRRNPQNQFIPQNQQPTTAKFGMSETRPAFEQFRPLAIPGNNIPPPHLATSPILTLRDGHLQVILDTLPSLWDSFLLGEELLHPTLVSSPFGIRFNERIINGQHVKHAVVYDASLVFFHSYPNPPSHLEWGRLHYLHSEAYHYRGRGFGLS